MHALIHALIHEQPPNDHQLENTIQHEVGTLLDPLQRVFQYQEKEIELEFCDTSAAAIEHMDRSLLYRDTDIFFCVWIYQMFKIFGNGTKK